MWKTTRALAVVLLVAAAMATAGHAQVETFTTACTPTSAWTRLPAPEEPVLIVDTIRGIMSVAAAWENPTHLWVGGRSTLYRSLDCGRTWQVMLVPSGTTSPERLSGVPTVVVDQEGTILVGGGYDSVVVSRDGGQNWQSGNALSSYLSVSPAQPGLVYAEHHRMGGSTRGVEGLIRSRDGGLTWEVRTFSGAYAKVVADALDPDIVYFSGHTLDSAWLLRSLEGGANPELFRPFASPIAALSMSVDGSRFWLATEDGKLFRSLDRGESWEQVHDTAYQGHLISLSASPHDPGVFFAVTNQGELWAYREPGPADFALPNGRFFTQTNGTGRPEDGGFAVTDEPGLPLYSTFSSLPLQSIGYPTSSRFTFKGLTTQLFQKLALQGQPDGSVAFLNLFDELHDAGKDSWLEAARSIPPPEDTSADAGLPWDAVVARHLAILDRDPALKAAYLSEPRWLELYGLPTGYGDYPEVSVVRGQRAALQRWKVDLPWARAGEVTVANGGEIAREAGLFPEEPFVPQPPPAS